MLSSDARPPRSYVPIDVICETLTDSYPLQLAFGEVKSEDKAELAKLISAIQANCASISSLSSNVD